MEYNKEGKNGGGRKNQVRNDWEKEKGGVAKVEKKGGKGKIRIGIMIKIDFFWKFKFKIY